MLEQAGQNKKVMDFKEKTVIFENKALEYLGGFVQLPRVVLRADNISVGSKLTYALLLSYAWQEDYCYPAQENLAKDLNITRQSVIKYLKDLQSKGLIDIKRRGLNRPNIYIIKDIPNGMSKKLTSGCQNSSLLDVNKQNTTINNDTILNNRYRYNNRDVKDVVSLFNLNFPEHKNTLRYKNTRNYLSKTGKEQMIINLENLSYINPNNPAGYLHTVIEKGDGIIKVTKEGQKTRKQKEEKDKEETFKEKFKQDWMNTLKTTNKRTYELLKQYEFLSTDEKRNIKEKAEKMVNKSFIGWSREKEVMCIIAGLIEKGE